MATPERPSKKSDRSFNYEVIWPLFGLTLGLMPLHMWNVRRRAHIQKGQRVLELGAGYPLWKIYSGQVGKTGLFLALDCNETISRRSRKISRFLNLGKERPSEQIITADASNLPFADESIDLLITNNLSSANAPETYTQVVIENVYSEAFRVLKPKGRIICAFAGRTEVDLLK